MAEEEEEEGKYYKDNFSSMDKSCQSGSPASLQDLINGRLSSSLQNLISQSRTIPSGKDFHFYNNFKEFRDPSRLFGAKSQDLLSRVGSVGRRSAGTVPDDLDDGYDWLVSVNDDVVERIGEAMDEFLLPRPGKIGVNSLMEEGGFQMVRGKKNERRSMTNGSDNHVAAGEGVSGVMIVVTMILMSRFLLHPYDTSAYINPPCLSGAPQRSNPPMWPHVGSAIEGSVVWDSVYFVRIAECGYEYEQTYAFFPILPSSSR